MRGQRYHGRRRAILPLSALAVTLWWWRRRGPFRVAVEGDSMLPTFAPGDFLIAERPLRLRRGSLVVIEHPARPGYEMVKRVDAVPGEEVAGRTLAPGEYWVLGDHPDGSTDSRHFGAVGHQAIRGVVRMRYWPPRRVALLGGGRPTRTR